MNKLHSIFFALLSKELCGANNAELIASELSELGEMGEEGLSALYSLAKAHDLAHTVGEALNSIGLTDSPTLSKFAKQQMLSLYRYEQLNFELGEIKNTLEKGGIDFIPLKGSVIRDIYPKPYYRTSCDIDILVREDNLERAIGQLVECLGYRVEGEKSFHDISLYSESGIHLELHFNIKEKHEGLDRGLAKVWEYASPKTEGSHEYILTPEFLMFHIIAHSAYHFYSGGCGVKPVCDIFLLRRKLNFDKAVLDELCRECGIEKFSESLFKLSDIWFGGEQCGELEERMTDYILGAGVYGTTETKVAASQAKSGSKFSYVMKRIFIPLDDLQYYYPVLQKHKWMLPIMWVRRWFRLAFKGTFSKSVKELKTGVAMPDQKNKYISSLLSDLEL